MASKNDVTGDSIQSKLNSDAYRNRHLWAFCRDPNHKPSIDDEPNVYECPLCGMKTLVERD